MSAIQLRKDGLCFAVAQKNSKENWKEPTLRGSERRLSRLQKNKKDKKSSDPKHIVDMDAI